MKRVVCFHLLNDFSGSPRVLQTMLDGLLERGVTVDLITSRGGILDTVQCRKTYYHYRFSRNPIVTTLRYLWIQVYIFIVSWRYIAKRNTFYINTLLPVGAALSGRLMGKRVVYHYHENADIKGCVYKILCWLMQLLATEIVCVSEYQRSFLRRRYGVKVIPNALSNEFIARVQPNIEEAFVRQSILMLVSLKLYKGIAEFAVVAERLPQYSFILVVSDTQPNIDSFICKHTINIASNLVIYPYQSDVVPFYHKASVVLNLSNREQCVETFGLTALEAMAVGLPVIVPSEGGIAEIVNDGVNGYKTDVQQLDIIIKQIEVMLSDRELYMRLAVNALKCADGFSCNVAVDLLMSTL